MKNHNLSQRDEEGLIEFETRHIRKRLIELEPKLKHIKITGFFIETSVSKPTKIKPWYQFWK